LLESMPGKSVLRFWFSVTGIVLSLSWRRPIAFVAAFYLGLRSLGLLGMRLYGLHAHRPSDAWVGALGILGGIAILLWAVSPYALIRFGVRDRFAQLSTIFAALATVIIYFWWIQAVAIGCVLAFVAAVIASAASDPGRRALLAVLATLISAVCGSLALMYFESLYQRHLDPTMARYITSPVITLYLPILLTLCITTACSLAYRLLCRRRPRSLAPNPTD
jgi:hypothetical protein